MLQTKLPGNFLQKGKVLILACQGLTDLFTIKKVHNGEQEGISQDWRTGRVC